MAGLRVGTRQIATVFDLLGVKENDLTYSIGWGLARSPAFLSALVDDVFDASLSILDAEVRLQQSQIGGGGFTDIEVQGGSFHLIIEAKRGWELPGPDQLSKYEQRFGADGKKHLLLTASECTQEFAQRNQNSAVGSTPIAHRSWKQIAALASCVTTALHERRLLLDLRTYLEGVIQMQDQRSNMVYVVSLSTSPMEWTTMAPSEMVRDLRLYAQPAGLGGFPKEPPNYLAFRYHGKLQSIHHVERWNISTNVHEYMGPVVSGETEPRFVFWLGPPIVPSQTVLSGPIRNTKVWSALDLLLTSPTVQIAARETKVRTTTSGAV